MTLKEATEAAEKMLPVTHNGIEYKRITEAGYQYDERGARSPFVQLLDKCEHSVTYADPGRCSVKPNLCSICGAEIAGRGHNAEPVNSGRCCDVCNIAVVAHARIKKSKEEETNE